MADLIMAHIRYDSGLDSTLGILGVPREKQFLCHTLEDEDREEKIAGETRIPAGNYEIKLRTEGSVHPRYAERFFEFHEGMLWLQDVPNFEWIYIHMGNTDDHSAGCILVGMDTKPDEDEGGGRLINSADAYVKVYLKAIEAMHRGDKVFINIRDWC